MIIGDFWKLVRRIDRLTGVEAKHDQEIAALRADVFELKARITRLEAREELVVAEAKAAAGTAAGVAASGYMSDIARRVGVLEAYAGLSGLPRLAPS